MAQPPFPPLSYRYSVILSIKNMMSLSQKGSVKLMHHQADSFQSEFISQRCCVCIRLLVSLQYEKERHPEISRKQTNKVNILKMR